MLFIAFYIAAQISISDVHIHLRKITYKYPIVIVCLLYDSGCCHVYFCCVKAITCMLWLKLTLFVMFTTASPFLSCQVYIPSITHITKRIYFHCICLYTLWAAVAHYSPKNRNPRLCNFSSDCIFKIAHLCRYPDNTG